MIIDDVILVRQLLPYALMTIMEDQVTSKNERR